jgi:predicted phosphodiesterase
MEKIRTSRIPRRTSFIVALLLLALPLIATAQNENSAKSNITFAVIGDTGTGDEAQLYVARQMVKQREKTPFEFVLMLGDNIYEKGEEKYIKSHFEEPYKDLLAAGVKFYAALGNHDIIRGLEFQTRYQNFNMGGRRYYNFAKGASDNYENLLEFFALDSNLMTPEQMKWLDETLKSSKARWKITFSHHSIYSSARMHGQYVKLRAQLEPLYVKHGVDAVFSGHSHCYERVKPQKGVHYFTQGASGEIKRKTLDRTTPLFAAGEDEKNSFLIVQAGANELKVEAIDADGSLIDSYTIKRAVRAKE